MGLLLPRCYGSAVWNVELLEVDPEVDVAVWHVHAHGELWLPTDTTFGVRVLGQWLCGLTDRQSVVAPRLARLVRDFRSVGPLEVPESLAEEVVGWTLGEKKVSDTGSTAIARLQLRENANLLPNGAQPPASFVVKAIDFERVKLFEKARPEPAQLWPFLRRLDDMPRSGWYSQYLHSCHIWGHGIKPLIGKRAKKTQWLLGSVEYRKCSVRAGETSTNGIWIERVGTLDELVSEIVQDTRCPPRCDDAAACAVCLRLAAKQ